VGERPTSVDAPDTPARDVEERVVAIVRPPDADELGLGRLDRLIETIGSVEDLIVVVSLPGGGRSPFHVVSIGIWGRVSEGHRKFPRND
jgi:hypothetical protein